MDQLINKLHQLQTKTTFGNDLSRKLPEMILQYSYETKALTIKTIPKGGTKRPTQER